ncbi:MAG: ankyrin repeat domain-containing protein [Gammaproteobacteria bacterium]|nr:ankyrin repeat domain-containing protein [Gammaproteobacteria bacterium]MCH9743883.1 ankyrin repeat domain-containing protein [Gammaproteobacteria bacterium]
MDQEKVIHFNLSLWMKAIREGDERGVRQGLCSDFSVNAVDKSARIKQTPLQCAIYFGQAKSLQLLLENITEEERAAVGDLFSFAIMHGRGSRSIIEMLEVHKFRFGNAVHKAAFLGHVKALTEIVVPGSIASYSVSDLEDNNAWLYAAAGGHLDMLKYLKGQAINFGKKNKKQQNALHLAIQNSCSDEVIEFLISLADDASHTLDLDAPDELGRTPLLCAAERGRCAVVQKLVATEQVKVDAVDDCGFSALHLTAMHGNTETLGCLLGLQQIPLESRALEWSLTPLLCAVAANRLEQAQCLVKGGADLAAKDKFGCHALDIATRLGFEVTADWLRTAKGSKGETVESAPTIARPRPVRHSTSTAAAGVGVVNKSSPRKAAALPVPSGKGSAPRPSSA